MKSETLIIGQLTDCHIAETGDLYRDVDVRQNFRQALQAIRQYPLDLLVISGDLAAVNGEIAAYYWLAEQLTDLPFPYLVMAGNHDRLDTLATVFNLPRLEEEDLLYFRYHLKGKTLLFLDSSSYQVSNSQLNWLQQQAQGKEQVLLFMHHPPTLCQCQFMDKNYPLQNWQSLWSTLLSLPAIHYIFCGHYHTGKLYQRDNKTIAIAPSTMMEIAADTPHFKVAHTRPGWQIIRWEGEKVESFREYVLV